MDIQQQGGYTRNNGYLVARRIFQKYWISSSKEDIPGILDIQQQGGYVRNTGYFVARRTHQKYWISSSKEDTAGILNIQQQQEIYTEKTGYLEARKIHQEYWISSSKEDTPGILDIQWQGRYTRITGYLVIKEDTPETNQGRYTRNCLFPLNITSSVHEVRRII